MTDLSRDEARRIALAAQGFAEPKPSGRIDIRHLRRVMSRSAEDAWLATLHRSLRGAVLAGMILVTIGIITGGLWAQNSWGVVWSWNHAEVGSLLVWLWFAVAAGALWIRRARITALPALSLSGGIVVLFGWFGTAGFAGSTAFLTAAFLLVALFVAAVFLYRREDSPVTTA